MHISARFYAMWHADQIIVIDQGKVAEIGNHDTLIHAKGKYYHLVKNQLELGN